ncbi:unnamed protein product, partial [Rotaria sp. Silwood2]
MFCIIDIIRHRHKVEIPTGTLNQLDSNQTDLASDVRLAQKKLVSTLSEPTSESLTTPHIQLKLFDDSEKNQLGDNDDVQLEKNSNESVTDKEDAVSFRGRCIKSNSSDNLLDQLSIAKPTMDTVRDILTRRRAL